MEWTDELITRLQDLWKEGLSTAEIGRQLSITKNAVVGKAHRLGLPPRPSPIRATPPLCAEVDKTPNPSAPIAASTSSVSELKGVSTAAKATPKKSAVKATEKERFSEEKTTDSATSNRLQPASVASEKRTADAKMPASRKANAPKKASDLKTPELGLRPLLRPLTAETLPRRGPACSWPHGDPGTPEFHFCGAKPVPGKPYCAEHCAIAYVKLRDRRENAG